MMTACDRLKLLHVSVLSVVRGVRSCGSAAFIKSQNVQVIAIPSTTCNLEFTEP
jgi:hypothetical protein